MISVTLYSLSPHAEADLDSVQALFSRLEDTLSISKPASGVFLINHRSDSQVEARGAVRAIMSACRKEFALSHGLFDVTVEPLKTLYGLESHQNNAYHVPTPKELFGALEKIGFGRIRFLSDSVFVMPPGMHLDFGGIAKGYILTQAEQFLLGRGEENFLINAGGDLVTCGKKPSGDRWAIGIQDPRNPGGLFATLACTTGCVFTSGDYERCFVAGNVRYHHLFDPATGKPGRLNMSATVVGANPLEADAVVKTAFLLPAQDALRYLASRGLMGLIVDSAKIGWASNGLKNALTADSLAIIRFR